MFNQNKNIKMKNILQIKKEFEELDLEDGLAYIDFYENNLDSIQNIDEKEDYQTKLSLKTEYGLSLVRMGHGQKGILVLKDVLAIFEKSKDPDQLKGLAVYESVLWNYGFALMVFNQEKLAYKMFKRLVLAYPENGIYQIKYVELRIFHLRKYTRALAILVLLWVLGEFTVLNNLDHKIQAGITVIGDTLLICWCILSIYIYWMRRRKIQV